MRERNRRWERVRSLMKLERLDVVIGIANTGLWGQLQASVRYLTNLGPSGNLSSVVFPVDDDVTAVTLQDRQSQLTTPWVDDRRPALFDHFTAVIDRMKELGLDGARIGIIGLSTGTRFPDGFIAHHGVHRIAAAFPTAQLLPPFPFVRATRYESNSRPTGMATTGRSRP